MNAPECFKFGFLARCASEGLSEDEIHARIDVLEEHLEKQAGLGDVAGQVLGKGVDALSRLGLYGAVAAGVAPFAVGAGLGYGQSMLEDSLDSKVDLDEVKATELVSEMNRLAAEAENNRKAKLYAQQRLQNRRSSRSY